MVIFMEDKVRVDKYLWCVRLFKTRRLASEACSRSKVKINDKSLKSSYHVKINDKITIKKKLINITIEVKDIISKRVSAKLVTQYINDITPESEKTRFTASQKIPHIYREKGLGRPTKKERRQLMKSLENYFES